MSGPAPEAPPLAEARAAALSSIAQAIGESLQLADVFTRVARAASLFLPFDGAGVTLLEEVGAARIYAVSGETPAGNDAGTRVERTGYSKRFWPDGGMPARRVADARVELDPSYPLDARIVDGGFRALLRIPLRAGTELLGFQWFVSRTPAAFTEEHQTLVQPISDLVCLALQHERLFRKEKERRRRREVLDALLPAVAEALDVKSVMNRISEVVQQVVDHDYVLVGLLSDDWTRLRLHAISKGEVDAPELSLSPEASRSFALESVVIRDIEVLEGTPPRARFHLTLPVPGPGSPPYIEFPLDEAQQRVLRNKKLRSELRVPLRRDGKIVGGLVIASTRPDAYREEDVDVARRIGDVLELSLAHQRLAEEMRRAAEERGRAERLEARVTLLREELESLSPHRALGECKAWRHVLSQATRVASVETTVLLEGESGTGKEVVARFIHRASPRRDGPFVAINCAALPDQLLESELFGYERGAFTGALGAKPGRIEQAAGGVLFLDEVGEMSPLVQAKLLRVLQEREFQRLGSTRVSRADVRVLAATNRDLNGGAPPLPCVARQRA